METFECKKCHALISKETWSKYEKRCKDCHQKDITLHQVDKRISAPAMLYTLCIIYGHTFLGEYLSLSNQPFPADPSIIITNLVAAITSYAIGMAMCILFTMSVHKRKKEQPEVDAAQRWYPILIHSVVLVATVICLSLPISLLLRS